MKKSTWINGLANYFQFETLDQDKSNGSRLPIQVYFTLMDPKTYNTIEIEAGEKDAKEQQIVGEIGTLRSKLHTFVVDGLTLKIIDTSGICDNSSTDEATLNNIKSHE